MGDMSQEPTMEDILASIRRIIAEDGDAPAGVVTASQPRHVLDDVLELTEAVETPPAHTPPRERAEVVEQPLGSTIVSDVTASASAQALAALSTMIVKPENGDNTLEGLVREMIRPLLKQWLDANLPELVEKMVAREIARITTRGG